MSIPERIKNKLKGNSWYHGTTIEGFHSILEHGVLVDFNRGRELDFGYGFYLTPKDTMAEEYISRLPIEDQERVILEFSFSPLSWFESDDFSTEIFEAFDERFAEFVFDNRYNGKSGKQTHGFDVVYGGMSDSLPTKLLNEYRAGEITREEVIRRLQKGTSMKQLSLHAQYLCDKIELKRAYIYDPKTRTRKELNMDERKNETVCQR